MLDLTASDGCGCGYRSGYGESYSAGDGCGSDVGDSDGYGVSGGYGDERVRGNVDDGRVYSYGYGDGFVRGYGYGFGRGDGGSYGSGYGAGEGHGCNKSAATFVGEIADYEVELIAPFGVVRIGCRVKTIGEWQRDWRAAAKQEQQIVDEAEVLELFAKVEAILRRQ